MSTHDEMVEGAARDSEREGEQDALHSRTAETLDMVADFVADDHIAPGSVREYGVATVTRGELVARLRADATEYRAGRVADREPHNLARALVDAVRVALADRLETVTTQDGREQVHRCAKCGAIVHRAFPHGLTATVDTGPLHCPGCVRAVVRAAEALEEVL